MVGAFLLGGLTASVLITIISYAATIGKDDEE